MNNRNTALAIAAIITATALTGVALAIPQQVMAGGYGHKHNHSSNSIKVDQQINQLNACTSSSAPETHADTAANNGGSGSSGSTTCLNFGNNSADIHR